MRSAKYSRGGMRCWFGEWVSSGFQKGFVGRAKGKLKYGYCNVADNNNASCCNASLCVQVVIDLFNVALVHEDPCCQ
eukprot:2527318-Ditylum_brightwellii.AAC.1